MNSQETPRENILGTEKISSLLVTFAVPGIVSMIVNSVYNIVDQIFIGRGVGYLGNGATNVVFPLTTLALAFAMMIGNGAGAYMSLMLGRKQEKEAAKGIAAGMLGTIVVGFTLMILYMIFMEPLLHLFGATDAIMPYALTYGRISAIGIPFLSISAGFSSIIRSDGSPKWNMVGLMMGCIINIILDPIFIFVFKMGVAGAGIATITGQFANCIMSLLYIPRVKSLTLTKDTFRHCAGSFMAVVNLGTSSFISQSVVVVAMAIQNNTLVRYGAMSQYGAEIPMTALGVTMKVFSILMAIVMGLGAGAQPIFGYNYGARKFDRVKTTFRYVITISIAVMTFAWILFRICPEAIVSIFGKDSPEYTLFSVKCLQIFLLGIPFGAVQMVSVNFFQSLGRPVQSSILSLSKQILFQLPLTLILPMFLGVEGVLWSGACSDVLACCLCLIMYKKYWKKMFEVTAPIEEREVSAVRNGIGFLGDGQVAGPNAPNVVITIGRSYGSIGLLVAKKLAEELQLPFYDGEILEQAAEASGLSKEYMKSIQENMRTYKLINSPVPLRDANVDGMDDLRRIADQAQNEIILKAAQGPCVIVGRRADQVLRGQKNLVRIFISGDMAQRAETIAKYLNISKEEAIRKINEVDKNRSDYYGELDGKVWGQADNYDLCLNTTGLGLEGSLYMIHKAVEGKLVAMSLHK